MDNDNDFTFCQVRPPLDEDHGVEVQRIVPGISGITLKDEFPNGTENSQDIVFSWQGKLPNNASSKKQETVGSLSYNVIETTPQTRLSESSRKFPSEDASSSVKLSEERKIAARKPMPRAKVPFEKGYSQMDWLKLTRTHPDLAGLKGQSNRRLISMNEVKQHQTEGAMWTVLKGRVYNLSPYMKFHPGGVDMLRKAVGKDCTSLFNKYHAWVNADFLLEKCLVGMLDDGH